MGKTGSHANTQKKGFMTEEKEAKEEQTGQKTEKSNEPRQVPPSTVDIGKAEQGTHRSTPPGSVDTASTAKTEPKQEHKLTQAKRRTTLPVDSDDEAEDSDATAAMRHHMGLSRKGSHEQTHRAIPISRESVGPPRMSRQLSMGARGTSAFFGPSRPVPEVVQFYRVRIEGDDVDDKTTEHKAVADLFKACLELRRQFIWTPTIDRNEVLEEEPEFAPPDPNNIPATSSHLFDMVDGVMFVWQNSADKEAGKAMDLGVPDRHDFEEALHTVMKTTLNGECRTFSHGRLDVLESRFSLHKMLNNVLEVGQQKCEPHRDFYNVRKVDNHVHHSACMNQRHLLRFIKHKMRNYPEEVVAERDGKPLTLTEVFKTLNITAYDLNVDQLDMHAGQAFQRFDKFNAKYNPMGERDLRDIFLKTHNTLNGRYLAELSKQVFDDLESAKYQFAEYRISIYGKTRSEWSRLAQWVVDNGLFHPNVRWMIQIPRLFKVYVKAGVLKNFNEMLQNIFLPLMEVTVDPSIDPKLHMFLQQVVGFDSVDDESAREYIVGDSENCTPEQWVHEHNPPYSTFSYYLYANLQALNKLRHAKQFGIFGFRPHCGEAGDFTHLAVAFLVADSINHGIELRGTPCLQYLFYLAQIGISVSPLSNNLLFLEYDRNPFPRFFNRGLNVTLSTDDPLMIHVTREPLVEEYSIASQVWKLTSPDMCEIARNSVLQSGFEPKYKAKWLGKKYYLRGAPGNDISKSNLPNIRAEIRNEFLVDEYALLKRYGAFESFTYAKYCDPL